jgi:hypothetical protein
MNSTQKFNNFLESIKDNKNIGLVESIQSGFKLIFESVDADKFAEVYKIAEDTINNLDTSSLYISKYQDIITISYYDYNDNELYADELINVYESEGKDGIVELVEKTAYSVLPADERNKVDFTTASDSNQDETEYFIPDEGNYIG